ncbi:unnamed protein product [Cylicostephanus goldi]|uniref:SXP/RAL-2 family protein Ani s 5-like cation-binding domain-containing protein n=1 Tax=Cylicostephanus goldi TaxID=71465 RepID=A0A3P6SXL1_CYLGO|nr:unnamed protein product [Cylicostephanus goldi]
MRHLIVALNVITTVWAALRCDDGPVYVRELEALVKTKSEKAKLKKLAEEKHMIRNEKMKQVDAILKKLPKDIKDKYQKAVKEKKEAKRRWYEKAMKDATKKGYGKLYEILTKKRAIDTDMKISDSEARKQEDAYKKKLSKQQRKDYDNTGPKKCAIKKDAHQRFNTIALLIFMGVALII